jgi:putative SOS response-associated peptidase YedK
MPCTYGENVDQEVFAFMTTEPNELTHSINHERMPVQVGAQLRRRPDAHRPVGQ